MARKPRFEVRVASLDVDLQNSVMCERMNHRDAIRAANDLYVTERKPTSVTYLGCTIYRRWDQGERFYHQLLNTLLNCGS